MACALRARKDDAAAALRVTRRLQELVVDVSRTARNGLPRLSMTLFHE
jgi:hypothetical protein